ncbi:MAG: DUF4091 domain-containing protein [Myxococcales bacterium]|nr:DUF4091 domain-containing protein [Myxococcales bacterium]
MPCISGRLALCLASLVVVAQPAFAALDRVWATEGGDKIARGERRALTATPKSRIFDGTTISLDGARGEVVNVALVLESDAGVTGLSVGFDRLDGAGGAIVSDKTDAAGVFDWTRRPIELFLVRYLQVKGLSLLTWGNYDERHVPKRFRRPWSDRGLAIPGTDWNDRPDHDAFYPDIAVPIERHPTFDIAPASSQLVWIDVFIPFATPPGLYTGQVRVTGGGPDRNVPISLRVRRFSVPRAPTAGTMMHVGYGDVNQRYLGEKFPDAGPNAVRAIRILDRHFQLAHRHRISLVDNNAGPAPWIQDSPRPEWRRRLDGRLFTRERGYDGPGYGAPNDVFAIGMYGSWDWKDGGKAAMWERTDAWESWFQQASPGTERFLFLIDESSDFPLIETWAGWVAQNPGPGKALLTLATADWTASLVQAPSLDLPVSTLKVADRRAWENASRALGPARRWVYNGARPATGSLALEDEGVALRMWGWAQFKKQVRRWFVWESTYYENFQGGTGPTDVFVTARTFGGQGGYDDVLGETGWNYTNGDGVLFYPGIDRVFPNSSLELEGPVASLRLKYWRRGLFDHDYLTLAAKVNPSATDAIVRSMIPVVLWEVDIDQPLDPTYRHMDISWNTDPDAWESARAALADLIEDGVTKGIIAADP